MNQITKRPVHGLGYGFIDSQFLPQGEDEYYLRRQQADNSIVYRNLTAYEIEQLVRNNNTSDDWNKINVSDEFSPALVKGCKFFGWVRIGKLEPVFLEYNNVSLPVGLYNSTVISCDFGDNVVVNNVAYMAHYIVGNEVMLVNVQELHTTSHAKFGNGIIKDGEDEEIRIWLELCNENGGRKIMPFDGMLPADAYLWSKYRDDEVLMEKFKAFTEKAFDKRRGYYGKIGDRTVIKNTSIIKDVLIGSDAYIKGANKLKNLTIDSEPEAGTQIGEGCELVNGIIGIGCRIFYGVKAVRFVMASHSQLKYGARLINSYLGNNATISCCEVLNSLIYPAHEQHHNNSFLCAALVMGQSNMAAGATIGSNHNSRAADGEIVAGRGFWPGLCVSLKHNSKFASFTLLAKGDYPAELNISIPFSLVSNDETANRLVIMPAYWFQYNMYALARNAAKYADRDKRKEQALLIEYDYLAPDTISEICEAMALLRRCAAIASGMSKADSELELQAKGDVLLSMPEWESFVVHECIFENSKRPVQIIKAHTAYRIYKKLIIYHAIKEAINLKQHVAGNGLKRLLDEANPISPSAKTWLNVGSQLMPERNVANLIEAIKNDTLKSWPEVHQAYAEAATHYGHQKFTHAWGTLLQMEKLELAQTTKQHFEKWATSAIETREWMSDGIEASRAKDYQNPFRRMVYNNDAEMEAVVGKLADNSFIGQDKKALESFRANVASLLKNL